LYFLQELNSWPVSERYAISIEKEKHYLRFSCRPSEGTSQGQPDVIISDHSTFTQVGFVINPALDECMGIGLFILLPF
jgi:hypothetical protein